MIRIIIVSIFVVLPFVGETDRSLDRFLTFPFFFFSNGYAYCPINILQFHLTHNPLPYILIITPITSHLLSTSCLCMFVYVSVWGGIFVHVVNNIPISCVRLLDPICHTFSLTEPRLICTLSLVFLHLVTHHPHFADLYLFVKCIYLHISQICFTPRHTRYWPKIWPCKVDIQTPLKPNSETTGKHN